MSKKMCAGCFVLKPFEHRCHGENCICANPVCQERQGRITHEQLMSIVRGELKMGNNGIIFGKGYKGKGMCASCLNSEVYPNNVPYVGAPPMLHCNYYAIKCRSAARNCAGIKHFRETPIKLERIKTPQP